MSFSLLAFFDNIWFHTILTPFIVFYLLSAVLFGSHLVSCDKFDNPVLLKSFNLFSTYFISTMVYFFCFDFNPVDLLYFFNQNFQFFFLFFVVSILIVTRDFVISKKIVKFEYDLLFIFVILSGVCLCFCSEFLLIYLAIELQSLAFYVFASFNRNSEFSTESGLKYFVFGGLMSCFLLLGLAMVYLFFGSLTFELIASLSNFKYEPLYFTGFLFVFIVFLFKVGSAPFHFWLCDVYEGSILSVTLLFAGAPKIVLFGLIFKLCFFVLYDYSSFWSFFFGLSGILSIIVGCISAIYQKRIKRLFAYSTIVHAGFILLAFLSCSLPSIKALIFYLVFYSFMTIALFALLINASINFTFQPKYIINLSGVGSKNYIFALTFCIIILAIAGVPPLAGFFTKFFILLALIGSNYFFVSFLVILFSSVACFYYIRLVKIMFFVKQVKNSFWITHNSKKNSEFIIASFLFAIMFYFIHPDFLIALAMSISLCLF